MCVGSRSAFPRLHQTEPSCSSELPRQDQFADSLCHNQRLILHLERKSPTVCCPFCPGCASTLHVESSVESCVPCQHTARLAEENVTCSGPSRYRGCQRLQCETLTALYHGSDTLPDWSGGQLEVLLGKGVDMRARFPGVSSRSSIREVYQHADDYTRREAI